MLASKASLLEPGPLEPNASRVAVRVVEDRFMVTLVPDGVGVGLGLAVGVGVGTNGLVVSVIPKEILFPPLLVADSWPGVVPDAAISLSPSQLHHCVLSNVPLPRSVGGVI